MDALEKNTGILTKDFIKNFINREKELENTIFELGEQIKALKSSDDKGNDIPRGYDIFMKMIKYASVSWAIGNSYDNMPTISINDCPLMPDEVEYVKRLIEKRQNEDFNIRATTFKSTYYGSNKVDVGIGESPGWYGNLANDSAWP